MRSDQRVRFAGKKTAADYPDDLRRVTFYDTERSKHLVFLINNFTLPALTIAKLYKQRWQVELFFKWIKQHLHIKAFFGTTKKAVKTQIWIAMITYLLVAIIKKRAASTASLYDILQILSISPFEKITIKQIINQMPPQNFDDKLPKQLTLFD